MYYAHSESKSGAPCETLRDHLLHVAISAQKFATAFNMQSLAFAAGVLHDLGKYSAQFQRRLKNVREPSRDHWSLGARVALQYGAEHAVYPALAILGHHCGLTRIPFQHDELLQQLEEAISADHAGNHFTEHDCLRALTAFEADGFAIPEFSTSFRPAEDDRNYAADMLDTRMLFSALVDADFLETESHFNGVSAHPRQPRSPGPLLNIDQAISAFQKYYQKKTTLTQHITAINSVRHELFTNCVSMSEAPNGMFSLTAPTGAGKTLAMLAFALHHARKHDLRRIILVMPFLNIIDQTAKIYRSIFSTENGFPESEHFLLEHHSLAADAMEPAADLRDSLTPSATLQRMLTENWDAPVILTTSVQLFESLHANKPSRCRKLHRLARSVILFDEVQTLPPQLASITLATLSRLCDPQGPYGSTVVFATATQPAFNALDARVRQYADAGWRPREIVSNHHDLFQRTANRVRVAWRHEPKITVPDLICELSHRRHVMCIVNLKRHAIAIAKELKPFGDEGLFHLSTNMCPAHREEILEKIQQRLADPHAPPVRLIATQCVEAGVDIDFPVVYRALAPLEAIAQAAGRCNRHGKLLQGEMVVFDFEEIDAQGKPRKTFPPGYEAPLSSTRSFLKSLAEEHDLNQLEILNDPLIIEKYYKRLYTLGGRDKVPMRTTDLPHDEQEIHAAVVELDFEKVAEQYRLINNDTINVIVPFDAYQYRELLLEVSSSHPRPPGFIREWLRRARKQAVAIYRPSAESAAWNFLEPIPLSHMPATEEASNWYRPLESVEYDPLWGLKFPNEDAWIA
jgi:CRISPR-associated endonuclease/helicase Cas3